MAQKFNVTGDQHFGLTGQMLEIQRQIRLNGGSPINPELVKIALQNIIEGKFNTSESPIKNYILRPLILDETMLIEDIVNSEVSIAKAKATFKSHIDDNFKNWGLDKSSVDTAEINVKPFELIANAKFAEIFTSFSNDLDELCFTQAQIIRFCEKYPRQLRQDGNANFFLMKENDEYFVVSVGVGSGGLGVHVRRFDSGNVWDAAYLHGVFVPATCTLKA
ncbi:MAG: hypothetical protein WCK37_01175 [Candidatus Falkowbacteria bacterium]